VEAPDHLTPSENARFAVENDPVRLWLESAGHQESLRLYKAVMWAKDLATCVALLKGQDVPVDRIDKEWARRYGIGA